MKVVVAYIPMVFWAVGVLAIGSLEFESSPIPAGSDKVAHFLAYGVGGALAAVGRRWSGRGPAWLALGFVALVAAADELRQTRIPTRHGDPWDWVADVTGALFFYFLTRRILGDGGGG